MNYTFKRWFLNFKHIISDFVTQVGLFWLIVEIASHSTNGKTDAFTKNTYLFLVVFIIILAIVFIKNKPKTVFSYKLRDKDNFIEIKVGDAFNNSGSLVIPFNDHLDVSLGGNVKKANSLQNKLITEYYSGKDEHLETDISKKTNLSQSPHDIGSVIEINQKNKTFYLLVNSKKKKNNRAESSIDDFLLSLSKLWRFITEESGRNSVITIPLIGTNHGRITNMNRSIAIKEIIDSYIDSSKFFNIADKLIISIHPNDLKKGDIALDDIDEYLKFSCKNYKITQFSDKPEGKAEEFSASKIKNIIR